MPIVSGGGFNGGTITGPLVIDLSGSGGGTVPVTIRASWNAQSQDFLQVVNSDTNTRMFAVDVSGQTVAWRHTSESDQNLQTGGSSVAANLPGVAISGGIGARRIGFYDTIAAAQQLVTSGSVTPAQLANALQATGMLGGT